MDEIRVEFVHIDCLFHVWRGAEAGEWRGGVVRKRGLNTERPRPC